MLERIVLELGNYIWFLIAYALLTVIFGGYLFLRTKEFSWNKKNVRAFAILYTLDTRGRICLAFSITRLLFIIYIAARGGSGNLWEGAAIVFLSLLIELISFELKGLLQVLTYAAVYAVLSIERLFLEYYHTMDRSIIIMFIIVSFGVFAGLYSIQQTIVGYENLITLCAVRDREKYDKGSKRNRRHNRTDKSEDAGAENRQFEGDTE